MSNPERVRQPRNPFRVQRHCEFVPRVVASSNPGLKLANAFGVFQTKGSYCLCFACWLCLKSTNRAWVGSVQGAVATWSVRVRMLISNQVATAICTDQAG